MALGTNRDYKTTHNRAQANLIRHYELMARFIGWGLPKTDASALALVLMQTSKIRRAIWRARKPKSNLSVEYLKLLNAALKAVPNSPKQKQIKAKMEKS